MKFTGSTVQNATIKGVSMEAGTEHTFQAALHLLWGVPGQKQMARENYIRGAALPQSVWDIARAGQGFNGGREWLAVACSAAVPGCEFPHRLGAGGFNRRRDAATTRGRGRLRYTRA
jgi:hypothetical protein